MDESIYPDPETFNPDRFLGENKSSVPFGSQLTFGLGPRACMGQKIMDVEGKILLFHLLRKYEIMPGEKLENPPRVQV